MSDVTIIVLLYALISTIYGIVMYRSFKRLKDAMQRMEEENREWDMYE